MATCDVPGANPSNHDELRALCWAEHEDGSLILVESTEDDRVIYSLFDVSEVPVVEFRDSMRIGAFKKAFSWDPKNPASEKWTWHDKTLFPWDRVIRNGARDGLRHAHADDLLSAAERVRRARDIHHGRAVDEREVETRMDRPGDKAGAILDKLQRAIGELLR